MIGAVTCHADVAAAELVQAEAPLLAHAAGLVGDPQIRHRGTIGGSLAHADPAADLPMALVALGGSVEITGLDGVRLAAAEDFFAGFFETSLEPGELVSAMRVPRRPGAGWGYQKFVRRANDWAIVGAAAVDGRIALANMGAVPLRARRWRRCWRMVLRWRRLPWWRPRGRTRLKTFTPTGSTGSIWRGC